MLTQHLALYLATSYIASWLLARTMQISYMVASQLAVQYNNYCSNLMHVVGTQSKGSYSYHVNVPRNIATSPHKTQHRLQNQVAIAILLCIIIIYSWLYYTQHTAQRACYGSCFTIDRIGSQLAGCNYIYIAIASYCTLSYSQH